jgi:hypothetical protein
MFRIVCAVFLSAVLVTAYSAGAVALAEGSGHESDRLTGRAAAQQRVAGLGVNPDAAAAPHPVLSGQFPFGVGLRASQSPFAGSYYAGVWAIDIGNGGSISGKPTGCVWATCSGNMKGSVTDDGSMSIKTRLKTCTSGGADGSPGCTTYDNSYTATVSLDADGNIVGVWDDTGDAFLWRRKH